MGGTNVGAQTFPHPVLLLLFLLLLMRLLMLCCCCCCCCCQVWRSILSESPSFKGSSWGEVSDAAKDFCKKLLDK